MSQSTQKYGRVLENTWTVQTPYEKLVRSLHVFLSQLIDVCNIVCVLLRPEEIL